MPPSSIVRGVGSPSATRFRTSFHGSVTTLVAAGAQQNTAFAAASGSPANPVEGGRQYALKEHIKRRIRYLRNQKAKTLASKEGLFEGFVHAVETSMKSISDLVTLCTTEGLSREAA